MHTFRRHQTQPSRRSSSHQAARVSTDARPASHQPASSHQGPQLHYAQQGPHRYFKNAVSQLAAGAWPASSTTGRQSLQGTPGPPLGRPQSPGPPPDHHSSRRPRPLTSGSHQCASTDSGANPAAGSPIRPEGLAAERHVSPSPARPGPSPPPPALHGGGRGATFTAATGRISISTAPPGQQDTRSAVLKKKCYIEALGLAEPQRVPAILLAGKLRPVSPA
ncbi:hypothetical protein NDU88_001442 [Pleurodeles waltl]|uniref:Uncharacterized protein n=1 Tax=Pleurodeles waltl TaxID=8319 RepID=A0AAV7USS2_PLEWA|nr:hypothetical protein NDU88_001442 [Pleurodeles waltl]